VLDVTHEINAVQRQVGSRVLDAGEARTVTIVRMYAAPIGEVWDACTNPERIPRWFMPVSGELRLGGRYQLEGNAGGTIERCDPPRGFAATWEYGGEVSWIELHLSREADGRTRFQLEHIAIVDDERWLQFGPGAVGIGWDLGLMGLSIHLESGKTVDPGEVAAWNVSDEGKQFVSLSSQQWCEASIAAGTDRAAAQASADRTTAFYTGADADAPAEAESGVRR
jgi:uncharacterized protein YndB with AHSA1/START domain